VCDKQTLIEKMGSKSEALDVWEDARQSPDGPLNNVSLGTRQLGVILNSLLLSQRENAAIKIGLETNTIAEQFLRDACRHATELRESDTTNLPPGTPFKIHHRRLVWHFRNQELKKKGFEELKNECCSNGEENGPVTRQLLGVITWEPHATWLASRSKNLVKVALNLSPDALGRPKHLSFDIVVSRASFLRSVETNRALRADFIDLIRVVWRMAKKLNNQTREHYDADLIERLKWYFDYDRTDDVLEAIGGILYSVRWNHQAITFLT
jgi:hypothetical protein